MGVFQRTFSVSLQRIGSPVALDTPLPSGPRNCGHWASATRSSTPYRINELVAAPVTSRFHAEDAEPAKRGYPLILCVLCDLCESTCVTGAASVKVLARPRS